MDIVRQWSPIVDVLSRLCKCTAGHVSYITDLEETVSALKMKTEELKAISNDVKSEVHLAEQQGMRQKEQVQVWLSRVEHTENKVHEIIEQSQQFTDGTSCLKKCRWSGYKMGKIAAKTLNIVTDLISDRRNFQEVAIQVQQPHLLALTRETIMPMEDLVGIESELENVQDALKGSNVGIIGLYGIGGVGKTTLLRKIIHNELGNSEDEVIDVPFRFSMECKC